MRDRLATLTPREFEVLKCVIAGMLNKQLPQALIAAEGQILP
jgi:FixJ family two-component response regulator